MSFAAVLDAYGHTVSIIHETRVGYGAYEDASQVIAEPFADIHSNAKAE